MKFHKHIITIPLVFLLGSISGSVAYEIYEHEQPEGTNRNMRGSSMFQNGDKLTSPLLDCTELTNFSDRKVKDARNNVWKVIEDQKETGHISDAAVYFRDLNNGPWFGINEKENFYPASLLKVPLMMAVYKQSMLQPGFINKEIEVTDNGFNAIETIKSNNYLKKGEKKTIDQIVESMIRFSDNNASHILNGVVDENVYNETYKDLGVELPDKPDYYITVKTYASFFRILYNSTYLWEPFSQRALELLTMSEFKDGLVAGVPGNILVAHKFGERQSNDQKQLHDCGIIYSRNPYLLCVMTRGKDNPELIETIKEISKTVYDSLDSK